jgi:protein SCO1/2
MFAGRSARAGFAAACVAAILCAGPAPAQFILNEVPEEARGLDVVERVGDLIPLSTAVIDSTGRSTTLGESFNKGRPVVLALAYYDCPVACPAVLEAMVRCFNGLDYTIGEDFGVAVVSFDPQDTTAMAAQAKAAGLGSYARAKSPEVEAGWQFYTASAEASHSVADAVGFGYRLLDDGEYSHPIALFVLTPEGKISKYFYGFEYPPSEMKLALIGAAEGQMSLTLGDRLLLFCYHYDPKTGTLTLAAFRLMQAGGIVTLVLLVSLVGLLKSMESRRNRSFRLPAPAPAPDFPVHATVPAFGPGAATQR